MTTKHEYLLQFHEALKRSAEEGVKFCSDKGPTLKVDKDLLLELDDGAGWCTCRYAFNDLFAIKWRVIEKPKNAEFVCIWNDIASINAIIPYGDCVFNVLKQFIGKRTKVTIEELP